MNRKTTTRKTIESDILQQVRNEVQEALLHHASLKWPDRRLVAIEDKVLDNTKMALAALSTDTLRSAGALRTHIAEAVAQTKRLIRAGRSK